MDRRVFMKSGALSLVTMGLSPSFLRRTAFGAELVRGAAANGNARGKTLICLFQRGAADALNVVVPHGESAYYRLRPNIAIPRPSLGAGPAGAGFAAPVVFGVAVVCPAVLDAAPGAPFGAPLAMLLAGLEGIGGPTRVQVSPPHRKPSTQP